MRVVAYCRVSTNKEEQLDSLITQQKFFAEYARKNGYELVCIYADEGKSGTKIKNRKQLLELLEDSKRDLFDMVLIKDISRLARNTVDFLTSIRKLKAQNIKVVFVNYDQTSSDSSEFMLTMLSAIAQEESANTSKRVRFGKRQNAKLGRVPNLVYGYDKIPGEYFQLSINQQEKEVVQKIFDMYTQENIGTGAIALKLNMQGIKTKRGCDFTQTGIRRILTNELYIGKIINGKEEVNDFLTGERRLKEEEHWIVVNRPELQIIDEETFCKTKKILEAHQNSFLKEGKRQKSKYIFSQLVICGECRANFRRITRTYKNTYHYWVCQTRNLKGKAACVNGQAIDEEELINNLIDYMMSLLNKYNHIVKKVIQGYYIQRMKDVQDLRKEYIEIEKTIEKSKVEKQKYITLYTSDIIHLEELKIRVKEIDNRINIEQIKAASLREIHDDVVHGKEKGIEYGKEKGIVKGIEHGKENRKENRKEYYEQEESMEELIKEYIISNVSLRKFLDQIVIHKNEEIDIYIKLL
ncbi:MAG: recombinase family protein [Anaerocolumna sp.]